MLLDNNETSFTPPLLFKKAFGRLPRKQEKDRVAEALSTFFVADWITYRWKGNVRDAIKYRCVMHWASILQDA